MIFCSLKPWTWCAFYPTLTGYGTGSVTPPDTPCAFSRPTAIDWKIIGQGQVGQRQQRSVFGLVPKGPGLEQGKVDDKITAVLKGRWQLRNNPHLSRLQEPCENADRPHLIGPENAL